MAATAAALVVHALPVVPTWLGLLAGGSAGDLTERERFVVLLYEPVFLTGGLLCAAAALAYRRSSGARLAAGAPRLAAAVPAGGVDRQATIARPRKYSDDAILDAALALLAERGPAAVTIPAIGAATGAPSGSIYHRFGSRDLLVARLWVRTVAGFQRGFLAALGQDDLDRAAVDAALHVVRWARDHPAEAAVLLLRRRAELAETWPDELGRELAELEAAVSSAVADHARRRYGPAAPPGGERPVPDPAGLARVMFAVVDVPYAACRRPLLAGRPLPPELDDLVADTVAHVLAIPPPAPG